MARKRAMTQRPYFRMGVGLIVAGAAFLALNIWLLITSHWVLPGPPSRLLKNLSQILAFDDSLDAGTGRG